MYLAQGFSPIKTGDEGCVGMRSEATGMIVASRAFMRGDYAESSVDSLAGRTMLYIHVASLAEAKRKLPSEAVIVEEVVTRAGTREALVDRAGDRCILAEKICDLVTASE
jgi:hypothetical protein